MKYCYNITFLIQGAHSDRQLEWIRYRVLFLRRSDRFPGTGVSIARVVAVPGMSDYGAEETSVTAQFEFADRAAAMAWGDTHFTALAGGYARTFGPQAYVMPSVIEMEEV